MRAPWVGVWLFMLLSGCDAAQTTDAGPDAAADAGDAPIGDARPSDAPPSDVPTSDVPGLDAPFVDAPEPMDVPTLDTPELDAPSFDAPVPSDAPTDVPPDAPCTPISGYRDVDGDGYGAGALLDLCAESGEVLVSMGGDCDDGDDAIHPGVTDVACDGVNADCDAVADADEATVDAACPWRQCVDDGAGGARCDAPVEVEAGWYHTCVRLERSHELWCWGRNDDGELGPGAPPGPNVAPWRLGVAADDLCTTANATCFISAGQVRCLGTVVPGLASPFVEARADAVEIACGDNELCVRSSDGTVRCAGSNAAGQCGTPPSTSMLLTALTPVPSLTGATEISVGANFACALAGGTVHCWGADSGILGRGTTTTLDPVPAPVSAPGVTFVEVEAMNFAACARASSGVVSCWGYTPERQVIGRPPPPDFVTAPLASTSSYGSLHAGPGLHACGLLGDGTIECWGVGLSLALGRANVTSAVPGVAMPGMSIAAADVAVASAASLAHTCAVERGTGRVLCWGANDFAQCGAPVSGTPLSTAVEVRP